MNIPSRVLLKILFEIAKFYETRIFFLPALPMSRDDIVKASSMFAPDVPEHVAEAVAFKYIDWEGIVL